MLLSAVSEAVGGADDMLLESVIKYVHPEFKQALMARVDTNRFDLRRQAEELCHFAQLMDYDTRRQAPREAKSWIFDRVGAVRELEHAKPQRTEKCYKCGKIEHSKRDCRKKG